MAAKKTLEQRISEILAEVESLTGGNAMLFVLPRNAAAPISSEQVTRYCLDEDADDALFVSRLYDVYFPSLLTEVRAIEKMGYAELLHEYGIECIDMLLFDCSEIEDATQKETMTNILLEARAKLTQHSALQKPRRTRKAILKKPS